MELQMGGYHAIKGTLFYSLITKINDLELRVRKGGS